MSVLKVSCSFTSILAHPIGLAVILVMIYISIVKIVITVNVYIVPKNEKYKNATRNI